MSKKLKDLKQKTRSAAKGGGNGQIFERFVNAHNARVASGNQSPSKAMAESGRRFADGFGESIRETTG